MSNVSANVLGLAPAAAVPPTTSVNFDAQGNLIRRVSPLVNSALDGWVDHSPSKIAVDHPERNDMTLDTRRADRSAFGGRRFSTTRLDDLPGSDRALFAHADVIAAETSTMPPRPYLRSALGTAKKYAAGTAGPKNANALSAGKGRRWHRIG